MTNEKKRFFVHYTGWAAIDAESYQAAATEFHWTHQTDHTEIVHIAEEKTGITDLETPATGLIE